MTTARNSAAALLQWGRETLLCHDHVGLGEPEEIRREITRHEAELLLQWATDWTRTELLLQLGSGGVQLSREAVERYVAAVRTRCKGTPLQYITGQATFYGRTFTVTSNCLIPRPETERLVEASLQWIEQHLGGHSLVNKQCPTVVDLGTGSGAIAITLALEAPFLQVHGVDVSEDALSAARQNAEALGAAITFHQADAIGWLNERPSFANVLVTNPPYIPSAEVRELAAEVRDYEPLVALDGGSDGLDFYRRLLEAGQTGFAPGPAALFMEVGMGQGRQVQNLFDGDGRWQGWEFHTLRDLRNVERVVVGQRLASL